MPVTMNDVRAVLDPEEVNYAAAAKLGPEALPHLAELVRGADMMMASKATYLASLIEGDQTEQILDEAAIHREAAVRVAAATGLKNLKQEPAAARLADRLLGDQDIGVRKMTVKSLAALPMPSLKIKLRQAAERDPEPLIREIAIQHLPR